LLSQVALNSLCNWRIALPVRRYFGTYLFCFSLLIDERQFPSPTLPKNLVHQWGIGRPPGTELRRFIQSFAQSLGPPDELGLLDCKVIFLRVCPVTSCGITKSSEHEAE
jgi:hypothetical protein